jgi:hypothetical protein
MGELLSIWATSQANTGKLFKVLRSRIHTLPYIVNSGSHITGLCPKTRVVAYFEQVRHTHVWRSTVSRADPTIT